MSAPKLTIEFNVKTYSGKSFADLVAKAGLSERDALNQALTLFKRSGEAWRRGNEFGAIDRPTQSYTLFEFNHLSFPDKGKVKVHLNSASAEKIQRQFGPVDDALTSAVFLFDQIVDALAAGKSVAEIDHRNQKFTEILLSANP